MHVLINGDSSTLSRIGIQIVDHSRASVLALNININVGFIKSMRAIKIINDVQANFCDR